MGEKVRYTAILRSSALAHLVAVLVTAWAAVVRFFLFGMLGDVEPSMAFMVYSPRLSGRLPDKE